MDNPQMVVWWEQYGSTMPDRWFAALEGGAVTNAMADTIPPGQKNGERVTDWLEIMRDGWTPEDPHADSGLRMNDELTEFIRARRDGGA
jgi:hypothetical protein